MSIAPEVREQRIVLHGVSWSTYQRLRAPGLNDGLRMTFDCGELEIMSPSRKHERISYLIGRMIDEWTLIRKIHVAAGRNTTFSRKDLLKGLEPDNCYWITHEREMRDQEEVDLSIHPPPDLALEVDVSRSSIPKLPIYRALRIPEVWRWQNEVLEVVRLDEQSQYQPHAGSLELPRFPLELATKIIRVRDGKSDTMLIARFIRRIKGRR